MSILQRPSSNVLADGRTRWSVAHGRKLLGGGARCACAWPEDSRVCGGEASFCGNYFGPAPFHRSPFTEQLAASARGWVNPRSAPALRRRLGGGCCHARVNRTCIRMCQQIELVCLHVKRHGPGQVQERGVRLGLAFTRYCHHQYCMVYGINRGGRWEG